MFVVCAGAGRGGAQQMLWQDYLRPEARTVCATLALPNAVEPVARGHYPGVEGGTFQILAEVLKDCGMLGRDRGEVIECFVYARRETSGRHVVTQYSLIRYLCKKARLRNQFPDEVGNILLSLRRKCLLISRSSAECNHDDFPFFRRTLC